MNKPLVVLLWSALLCAVFTATAITATTTQVQVQPLDIRIEGLRVDTHDDLVIQTHTPHFSWKLTEEYDVEANRPVRSVVQQAYRLTIKEKTFSNVVLDHEPLFWDSGKVESSMTTHIKYVGEPFHSDTRYEYSLQYWSSTGAESSEFQGSFRTALFELSDWTGNWIGSETINMNELRKVFLVPLDVVSATVFISGIGYYELYLNGQNVDATRKLDVGWTTYEIRTLYSSFDLSDTLQGNSENAIGILLGDGWYSQEQYSSGKSEPSYGPPRVIFQLNIVLSDGSNISIVTDETWMGREGALRHAGVYRGEIYDSRLERPGWSEVNFTDPTMNYWMPAQILKSPLNSNGILSLQPMDPIRKGNASLHVSTSASRTGHDGRIEGVAGASILQTELKPVTSYSPAGVPVFDLGQNFAGICSYNFNLPRGFSVFLRYGEVISKPFGAEDGNYHAYNFLYTDNLRNAVANDIFIANGSGSQIYESKFTYHGFRYVQAVGSGGPDSSDVTCSVVHSETTLVGNFTSTNPIINQIQHNVLWGQASNLMSLPSDCTQRDERKGWMGDAGLTVDEALFNYDLSPFYKNFLTIIRDAQGSDGAVGDTAPLTFGSAPADPNWGTAYPTIVWYLHDHYGDMEVIENFIDDLVRFIDDEIGQYNSTGLANMFYHYGDWVPPMPYPATNQSLTSSYAFLRDVSRIATMAAMVNHTADADRLNALYSKLTTEFQNTFYVPSQNGYSDNMQAANVFALASPGVVPDSLRAGVVKTLVNDITSKGQLTTGISSTANLFTVLSDNGQHDLSLMLLSQTSYPSYGYTFTNDFENSTTLWELWQGPMDDNSGGGGMNSRNHHMFGSVGAYFYRTLAGIHLNGLQTIDIQPRMAVTTEGAMALPRVQAEVQTIKGGVIVEWSRDDADMTFNEESDIATLYLSVTVPANTNARIHLEPLRTASHCNVLMEGDEVLYKEGLSLMEANAQLPDGITTLEEVNGIYIVHVNSGSYNFKASWTKSDRDVKQTY